MPVKDVFFRFENLARAVRLVPDDQVGQQGFCFSSLPKDKWDLLSFGHGT